MSLEWDLSDLLDGRGEEAVDELLAAGDAIAAELEGAKGTVSAMDGGALLAFMERMAELEETVGRAAAYASLRFAADMLDSANGARMQRVQERLTALSTRLVFFALEWACLTDERAAALLETPGLDFCRHH